MTHIDPKLLEHPDWYSLQTGPFEDDSGRYGVQRGEAFYYYLFPNLALNVMPGRLQTNLVVPAGPTCTRVHFDYFYADVESSEARRAIEQDVAFGDRVQREDVEICEHVQRGLASDAYDRGRFSVEAEACVHHFQGRVKRAYADWLSSSP